ncbi:MAG: class I SAM-dependent methyltransferase [Rhodospirillaceae bacterium]|nr:class I SAM-dependent methyltransferase [Rhodospirillaceae bacterium]
MTEAPDERITRTAAWVATYRATESARKDRLFDDPYAARFAVHEGLPSERGADLAAAVVTARTVTFDELIGLTLDEGRIDAVLCLACGYDTRPYRLTLPATLTWIEADLPFVIQHKAERMANAEGHCKVERFAGDLRDAGIRARLLARVARDFQRVLVITEGLLLYLTDTEARDLATALHDCTSVRYWLTDLMSPMARQRMNAAAAAQLNEAGTTLKFAPAAGASVFQAEGWDPVHVRPTFAEMRRLGRVPGLMLGLLMRIGTALSTVGLATAGLDGTVLLRARKV